VDRLEDPRGLQRAHRKRARTAGDSPAAMIRISSGVTAANACGTRRELRRP
jgi:hypothetical protein